MNKTKQYFKFLGVGLFIAYTVEFILKSQFAGNATPKIFLMVLIFYPVYLTLVYFSSKLIDSVVRKRFIADLVYYATYGFIGLFIIEWILLNNSPAGNPNANQLGMFGFWAAVALIARIFIDHRQGLEKIKRNIKFSYVAYLIVAFIGKFALPGFLGFAFSIYFFVAYFVVLNLLFIPYFKMSYREGLPR
jgi:hypothetical protein